MHAKLDNPRSLSTGPSQSPTADRLHLKRFHLPGRPHAVDLSNCDPLSNVRAVLEKHALLATFDNLSSEKGVERLQKDSGTYLRPAIGGLSVVVAINPYNKAELHKIFQELPSHSPIKFKANSEALHTLLASPTISDPEVKRDIRRVASRLHLSAYFADICEAEIKKGPRAFDAEVLRTAVRFDPEGFLADKRGRVQKDSCADLLDFLLTQRLTQNPHSREVSRAAMRIIFTELKNLAQDHPTLNFKLKFSSLASRYAPDAYQPPLIDASTFRTLMKSALSLWERIAKSKKP